MGATLQADGFLDLIDRLRESADNIERDAAAALDTEFMRQMESTTVGPTGRLKASLTSRNSDHIFQIDVRGRIRIGSRDPAARYQRRGSRTIPTLDPQPFFNIIAQVIFRDIKSGGKQRG
jgi:hypothetical protein